MTHSITESPWPCRLLHGWCVRMTSFNPQDLWSFFWFGFILFPNLYLQNVRVTLVNLFQITKLRKRVLCYLSPSLPSSDVHASLLLAGPEPCSMSPQRFANFSADSDHSFSQLLHYMALERVSALILLGLWLLFLLTCLSFSVASNNSLLPPDEALCNQGSYWLTWFSSFFNAHLQVPLCSLSF